MAKKEIDIGARTSQYLDNILNIPDEVYVGPMMDETMKALADPTRREILRALRKGDLSAGEIAARFDMTAPSISHHLNVLKEAGLVEAVRDGRHIIYSLNSTVVQDLMNELMEFMNAGKQK